MRNGKKNQCFNVKEKKDDEEEKKIHNTKYIM